MYCSYRKRKSLIIHYKKHCDYCYDCGDKRGSTPSEIVAHNRAKHILDYPFVCEICGESFSRSQQFDAHAITHTRPPLKRMFHLKKKLLS